MKGNEMGRRNEEDEGEGGRKRIRTERGRMRMEGGRKRMRWE